MVRLARLHRLAWGSRFSPATAVLVVGIAGVATGAIPGPGDRIDACYTRIGGVLRVIDAQAGQTCTRVETGLHWNVQGQPRPAGERGPQGPPGTMSVTRRSANSDVAADHGR
jgi:hypothetical protein